MKSNLLTASLSAALMVYCYAAKAQQAAPDIPIADTGKNTVADAGGARNAASNPNKPVYPINAMGYGPKSGLYMYNRSTEDWSDASKAPSYKHVQLGRLPNSYITLLAEHRTRLNYTDHPGLKTVEAQDAWQERNVIGFDAHFGTDFRIFGEANNSIVHGHNPGKVQSAQQENDAVVQQLFAEYAGHGEATSYQVKVGRQEFMDGPPNIIHIRPAPDVYTFLDGVTAAMQWQRFRFTAFDLKTVVLTSGGFDDSSDDGDKFRGVTTSFAAVRPDKPGDDALYIDPFAWELERQNKKWGPQTADEDRKIYGTRIWGNFGASKLDASLIRQDGDYGDNDVSAWGFFSNASRTLPGKWKPTIGFHADYTSGGGAYAGHTMRDFTFFYGSIPYFTWGNLIGPTNLTTFAPTFRLSPLKNVSFGFEYEPLRRVDEKDAVYTFSEGVYAGTQNVPGHDVGALLRGDIAWQINTHVETAVKIDYLDAGSVLKEAGYGNTFFAAVEATLRF